MVVGVTGLEPGTSTVRLRCAPVLGHSLWHRPPLIAKCSLQSGVCRRPNPHQSLQRIH